MLNTIINFSNSIIKDH